MADNKLPQGRHLALERRRAAGVAFGDQSDIIYTDRRR